MLDWSKIARLEEELRRFKLQTREPVVPSVVPPVKAEAGVQLESRVAAPSSTDLQSPQPMPAVDALNALVPEEVLPEQPETALTEPLMLLEVPQLEERRARHSVSLKNKRWPWYK